MKKKDFLDAVEHEVRKLREVATKEELSKLDLKTLNPNSQSRCIYGQMTGSCEGDRAISLLEMTCPLKIYRGEEEYNNLNRVKMVNKASVPLSVNGWYKRDYFYISPLELYIMRKDAKLGNVINFLRGETDNLKL